MTSYGEIKMAKFYGVVGYSITVEKKPGVFVPEIIERYYSGDLLRFNSRYQTSGNLNEDITVSNEISIIADPFAYEYFQHMRYINFMGTNWRITNADASNYPRIILTLGGVYNAKKQNAASGIT